jgi:saccharopine dehydrogenase-like NADP-dependent oxidoreductase
MEKKMQYAPGERDMLVLMHAFQAEFPGGKRESISSTMIDYGVPKGDTSMARTVSLPAAVAVRLILEGGIKATGVQIPVTADLYDPVLDELADMGIRCEEKTTPA